jgi:catechol 2,3-dioxygenase-like lactoylglutathione lyase family enzyme
MSRWPAVQHLSFPVRDVLRAAAFYRDFLGFSALREPDEHIAELAMGATKLVLLRGRAEAPKELHFGFAETHEGVDEWGRRARDAGVTVESGPGKSGVATCSTCATRTDTSSRSGRTTRCGPGRSRRPTRR